MFRLSPQQYESTLSSLQAAATGETGKRSCLRMEVQAPIRLGIIADHKLERSFIGLSRDISIGGVGLYMAAEVKEQERILVSLPMGKKNLLLVCEASVCRELADGIYWVGAQFDFAADGDLINQFSAAAAAPSAIPQTVANFCGVSDKK